MARRNDGYTSQAGLSEADMYSFHQRYMCGQLDSGSALPPNTVGPNDDLSAALFDPWFGITADELGALSFPIPSFLSDDVPVVPNFAPPGGATLSSRLVSPATLTTERKGLSSSSFEAALVPTGRPEPVVPEAVSKRKPAPKMIETRVEVPDPGKPCLITQLTPAPATPHKKRKPNVPPPSHFNLSNTPADQLLLIGIVPLKSPAVTRLISADRRRRKREQGGSAKAATRVFPTIAPSISPTPSKRETVTAEADRLSEADVLRFYYEQALAAAPSPTLIATIAADHAPRLVPHAPLTAKRIKTLDKPEGAVPVTNTKKPKDSKRAAHVIATCNPPAQRKIRSRLEAGRLSATTLVACADGADPQPSDPVLIQDIAEAASTPISPRAVNGPTHAKRMPRNATRPRISESDVWLFHQTRSMPATNVEHDNSVIHNTTQDSPRHFSRTSSASVSDMFPTSPMSDSDFSFLMSSSPPSPSLGLALYRPAAPRWQVASPIAPVALGTVGSGLILR